MGTGTVSDAFATLGHTHMPWLALMWKMVTSLIVTCYAMFDWYSWKTCQFLNKSGGGVDMGGQEKERTGRRWERVKQWLGCK